MFGWCLRSTSREERPAESATWFCTGTRALERQPFNVTIRQPGRWIHLVEVGVQGVLGLIRNRLITIPVRPPLDSAPARGSRTMTQVLGKSQEKRPRRAGFPTQSIPRWDPDCFDSLVGFFQPSPLVGSGTKYFVAKTARPHLQATESWHGGCSVVTLGTAKAVGPLGRQLQEGEDMPAWLGRCPRSLTSCCDARDQGNAQQAPFVLRANTE